MITMGMATGDLMRVADFQAKQLLLSLRTGEPFRLVRALAYEAIFSSARGNRPRKEPRSSWIWPCCMRRGLTTPTP